MNTLSQGYSICGLWAAYGPQHLHVWPAVCCVTHCFFFSSAGNIGKKCQVAGVATILPVPAFVCQCLCILVGVGEMSLLFFFFFFSTTFGWGAAHCICCGYFCGPWGCQSWLGVEKRDVASSRKWAEYCVVHIFNSSPTKCKT